MMVYHSVLPVVPVVRYGLTPTNYQAIYRCIMEKLKYILWCLGDEIMDRLWMWIIKPAHWYEFWKPQSGIGGGFIVGAIACIILTIIFKLGALQ